ncbi:RCC1/BLIP-II protein [Exidia glandulosa HHB12029]|uniref:RCC1/BLIP-II protein n=1 Tax=Exidia glandulosa HHB12029 TaxID=1314781 RepID=A0A165E334_EXIGL|nr:RCC1/BLIP-II protein [Exidia glandulosa HHB12029]
MHAVELCAADETLRVRAISAGPHHVLVVVHCLSEGIDICRVFGWGASRHSQLGVQQAIVPTPRIIHQSPCNAPDSIASVACGSQHSLLLRSDGTVEGLGSNRKAQLTFHPDLAHVRSIACSWNTSYALSRAGVIHAWGSGNHGQLATASAAASSKSLSIGGGISTLACGSEHIIVLGDDGTSWGWGWNEHGNLGLRHNQDVHEPTNLQASRSAHTTATGVVGVWAGCGTSWLALA